MKRYTFTTALLSVGLFAVWIISRGPSVSSSKSNTDEIPKESASKGMSIPKAAANVEVAPVYDSTGALVSDPSGTIWNRSRNMATPMRDVERKVAPVFDPSGAVVSDPSGILSPANHP